MVTGSFSIFGKLKQNLKNHIQICEELTWSFSVSGHFKLNASENKNTSLGIRECMVTESFMFLEI